MALLISDADGKTEMREGRGMAGGGTVYLMYHELERADGPPCLAEEGYRRYIVTEAQFRNQIRHMLKNSISGISVTEALQLPSAHGVAITFDDGFETDLTVAAPLLREACFSATFYLVVGSIGAAGRLSLPQVRELERFGFEIGCHSMSHPHLTELSGDKLHREIVDAKKELEQMIGKRVDHFSCPGGRWNRSVAELARKAGYRSVTTSRIGVNLPGADPYSLARVAVMRRTTLTLFENMCRGKALWRPRMRELVLKGAKRILGNAHYDKVRSGMLRGRNLASLLPAAGAEQHDRKTGE